MEGEGSLSLTGLRSFFRPRPMRDDRCAVPLNALLQQIKVNRSFRVGFQNEAPRIPTLCDVMGNI